MEAAWPEAGTTEALVWAKTPCGLKRSRVLVWCRKTLRTRPPPSYQCPLPKLASTRMASLQGPPNVGVGGGRIRLHSLCRTHAPRQGGAQQSDCNQHASIVPWSACQHSHCRTRRGVAKRSKPRNTPSGFHCMALDAHVGGAAPEQEGRVEADLEPEVARGVPCEEPAVEEEVAHLQDTRWWQRAG